MTINPHAADSDGSPGEFSWDSTGSLLYSLGVGAGVVDPTSSELQFTTENSQDLEQRALPTMAVTLGNSAGVRPDFGEYDLANLVHGEQSLTVHQPIPVAGSAVNTPRVASITDKGKAAAVVIENQVTTDGDPLWTTESTLFIRGEGGFGNDHASTPAPQLQPVPERDADLVVECSTRRDQALLYRLTGDRNPLHSDPKFAERAGFSTPILHGLCTYGVVGRHLLHQCCGSDPAHFEKMAVRFSAPVLPGDTIALSVWQSDQPGEFSFRATVNEAVVLDRGLFRTRQPSSS